MQTLSIEIFESPEEAPNYSRDSVVRSATIGKVVIVKNGTTSGKPTVDFQFTAKDGSQFVAMLTGELVKGIAQAVEASQIGE